MADSAGRRGASSPSDSRSPSGDAARAVPSSGVLDTVGAIFAQYAGGARGRSGSRSPVRSSKTGAHDKDHSSAPDLVASLGESEIRRLGRLWRDMKAGYDDPPDSPGTAQMRAQKTAILRQEAERHSSKERDLQDKHRFMELQLSRLREEADGLREALRDKTTKLSESLAVLEERATSQEEAIQQSVAMRSELEEVKRKRDQLYQRAVANLRDYEADSAAKQRAIEAGEQRVAELTVQLEAAKSDLEKQRSRNDLLEAEAARSSKQEAAAVAEVERIRADAQSLTSQASSAGQLRAYVRHLRADNARLIRLLATTKEYQTFVATTFARDGEEATGRLRSSYLAATGVPGTEGEDGLYGGTTLKFQDGMLDDADDGGEAAYWAEMPRLEQHYEVEIRQDLSGQPASSRRGKKARSSAQASKQQPTMTASEMAASEGLHWIPADAMKLTVAFRKKYLRHLPPQAVREFLYELNSAWRARMAKSAKLLKNRYSKTIAELRRTVQQKQPFREVLQASTISRLHTQLVEVRRSMDGPSPAVYRRSMSSGRAPLHREDSPTKHMSPSRNAAVEAVSPHKLVAAVSGMAKASASMMSSSKGGADADHYGWAAEWSLEYPASTGGAIGHNAAGWSRAKEHHQLVLKALQAVEHLSQKLAAAEHSVFERDQRIERLRSARARARQHAGAEDGWDDDVSEVEAEEESRAAARQAVASARLNAHTRAITWLGSQVVRMADAMGDEVESLTSGLRHAVDSGGSSSALIDDVPIDGVAIRRLAGDIDRAIGSYRSNCRRAFEAGLEAGTTEDSYAAILGAIVSKAPLEDEAVVEVALRSRSASPSSRQKRSSRSVSRSGVVAVDAMTPDRGREVTADRGVTPPPPPPDTRHAWV
jgi:hypothetical protein